MAVAAEMKRAGGCGGNGGGGRGHTGGNPCVRSDLPAGPVEASGVACQSREGTPLTNPARISVLPLRADDNTRDVLSNVDLPTLGGSVWCKRWHRGGRCFSGCDRKGSHIPPTAAALETVTDALKLEQAPG